MPTLQTQSCDIHYDVHRSESSGRPWVTLIPGLASNTETFPYIVDALSVCFHVLVFDPRGAGRTRSRRPIFSLGDMAQDLACILDALEIDRTHILGISMGGMVAQEFVFRFPDRVGSLVLCCTMPGAPDRQLAPWSTVGTLLRAIIRVRRRSSRSAAIDDFRRLLFSASFDRDEVIRFFQDRAGTPVASLDGVVGQLLAVRGFRSRDRHRWVRARTMVITGTTDALVPTQNSDILARLIPGAKLVRRSGGHVFFYEDIPGFNHEVCAFFSEPSATEALALGHDERRR